ncbi:MAG: hypothetical protein IH986_15040 [Planctomycetes bacterium]|nr:hypothetical protein [Planctomycetota bacterium]
MTRSEWKSTRPSGVSAGIDADFKEGEPELFKKLKIHRFGDDEEPS